MFTCYFFHLSERRQNKKGRRGRKKAQKRLHLQAGDDAGSSPNRTTDTTGEHGAHGDP